MNKCTVCGKKVKKPWLLREGRFLCGELCDQVLCLEADLISMESYVESLDKSVAVSIRRLGVIKEGLRRKEK